LALIVIFAPAARLLHRLLYNKRERMHQKLTIPVEPDRQEIAEWIEAFDQVVDEEGASRGTQLLQALSKRAREAGVDVPVQLNTPYLNTIPVDEEVPYPGDRVLERRIKSLVR